MIRERRALVWVGTLPMRVGLFGVGWVAGERMGRSPHRVIVVTALPTTALHLHCLLDVRGYRPVVVASADELRDVLAVPVPNGVLTALVVEYCAELAGRARAMCGHLPVVLLGDVPSPEALPRNTRVVRDGEARNLRLVEALEERLRLLRGEASVGRVIVPAARAAGHNPYLWNYRSGKAGQMECAQ